MKKLAFIMVIIFVCQVSLQSQDQAYSIGQIISLQSDVLDEERSILVFTPLNYDKRSDRYPVMYLLDGKVHFHHATGIVDFLSLRGLMPEMIVVAITNVDRTRDFSPTHIEKWPTTGGAEKFMGFLSDELIPYMDKRFRTQPFKILVGHSFGGEFAAYALLNQPEVFDAYIANSPYIMYDDNYIVNQAKSKLKSNYEDGVQFYMAIGNEPDYFESLTDFKNIIEDKSPKGFEFEYIKMENESHVTIPHLSIYNGLEWIYRGWALPQQTLAEGLAAIDAHYEFVSKKYGFDISTPENVINQLGYNYLGKKDYKTAIEIFQENVKRYPKSANVYDSLGEALENDGQFKKAGKNYKKAVKIATKTIDPNLLIFEENMQRMQEKVSQK